MPIELDVYCDGCDSGRIGVCDLVYCEQCVNKLKERIKELEYKCSYKAQTHAYLRGVSDGIQNERNNYPYGYQNPTIE